MGEFLELTRRAGPSAISWSTARRIGRSGRCWSGCWETWSVA